MRGTSYLMRLAEEALGWGHPWPEPLGREDPVPGRAPPAVCTVCAVGFSGMPVTDKQAGDAAHASEDKLINRSAHTATEKRKAYSPGVEMPHKSY